MSPGDAVKEQTSRRGSRQRRGHRLSAASPARRAKALLLAPLLIIGTLGLGWLAWSAVEWRQGRTPSYRLTHLRVVRQSDGHAAGWCRSALRVVCCAVLVIPTLLACSVLAIAFVMGASPPDGLLRQARSAPWDVLTRTEVIDERVGAVGPGLRLGRNWPAEPSSQLLRSGDVRRWRQN